MQALIDALLRRFPAGDAGLIALVDLMVLVAIADGTVDDTEMATLRESLEALVGSRLEPSLVDHLVNESVAQLRALGPGEVARDVGEVLAKHQASEEGVRLALAIAAASDGVSAAELERIGDIARAAGVAEARLDEMVGGGS